MLRQICPKAQCSAKACSYPARFTEFSKMADLVSSVKRQELGVRQSSPVGAALSPLDGERFQTQ